MLDFPKKRDKTSRLLRNTQRQVSFHVYRSFGIIHVKCRVKLYLVFVFLKGQYESKYGFIFTFLSIYLSIYLCNMLSLIQVRVLDNKRSFILSSTMTFQKIMIYCMFLKNWLGLVWFYGISTIVGHFMPNPFYAYIKYMISKHILTITF